jgi:hypothetical protein
MSRFPNTKHPTCNKLLSLVWHVTIATPLDHKLEFVGGGTCWWYCNTTIGTCLRCQTWLLAHILDKVAIMVRQYTTKIILQSRNLTISLMWMEHRVIFMKDECPNCQLVICAYSSTVKRTIWGSTSKVVTVHTFIMPRVNWVNTHTHFASQTQLNASRLAAFLNTIMLRIMNPFACFVCSPSGSWAGSRIRLLPLLHPSIFFAHRHFVELVLFWPSHDSFRFLVILFIEHLDLPRNHWASIRDFGPIHVHIAPTYFFPSIISRRKKNIGLGQANFVLQICSSPRFKT